jgi:hypothetical protein
MKELDMINIINRIDLSVSYSKVKVHLDAFRHVVGVDTDNSIMLLQHLGEIPNTVSKHGLKPSRTANTARNLAMNMFWVSLWDLDMVRKIH